MVDDQSKKLDRNNGLRSNSDLKKKLNTNSDIYIPQQWPFVNWIICLNELDRNKWMIKEKGLMIVNE